MLVETDAETEKGNWLPKMAVNSLFLEENKQFHGGDRSSSESLKWMTFMRDIWDIPAYYTYEANIVYPENITIVYLAGSIG